MVTPLESEIRKLLEDVRPTEELMAKLGTGAKDFENDTEFVAGYLKACLVRDILMAMKEEGINRQQLAERLGKSRQYVSRILNETANFTLQSIAELACALGRKVHVGIHADSIRVTYLQRILREFTVIEPFGEGILLPTESQPIELDKKYVRDNAA